MIIDCDIVRQQYRALKNALPGVILHFALKPLPHPAVVRTLMQEGASFDLASNGEVDMVAAAGVPADMTIQSHPIKRDSDIRHTLDYGCKVFIVDNINELEKFIPFRDQVELFIRLSFRNADSYADLSKKFGCSPQQTIELIQLAKDHGIHIKGLSFHVGSQTAKPEKFVQAIKSCAQIFHDVADLGLPALSTIDIGGGFPFDYHHDVLPIDEFCAPIREALVQLPETVKVIAEPGRFIVAPSVTSVSSVMGQSERDGKTWYYLDDGIYGSYSGIVFDHGKYPIDALHREGDGEVERFPCVLAGPTCDSIDVVAEDILLPKLNNGDLIIGRLMGAYSTVTATDFNFFKKASIISLNEETENYTERLMSA
ncbi:MAG: type III PLP-dependent enzyme [Gammaproteobacteria bacterium]|nr:type III PLP-dependent enzyme [Gammaproteobacteria bacterium]